MPVTISVNNVKAADPGLGFSMQINNNGTAVNQTVAVSITLGGTYTSQVNINNPVSDTTLNFIIPFGDNSYQPNTYLNYVIKAWSPIPPNFNPQSNPDFSTVGNVLCQSGTFNFKSSLVNYLADGGQGLGPNGMMNSLDTNYVGIMQMDGNFCVYPQFARGNSPIQATDSSWSDYGYGNYSIKVVGGQIQVINNINQSVISASNRTIPGASMVIDTNGHICLLPSGSSNPTQVQVKPQFVN